MQNRYAGDVGDFGKFGLLRSLDKNKLKVGVNWYLVCNEAHNADGKYVRYLSDSKFMNCDDELLEKLGYMVYGSKRSVKILESMNLIQNVVYYDEELLSTQIGGKEFRNRWHKSALEKLNTADIVFLDPDNGLLPKSVTAGMRKSIKYIFHNEILDYYLAGCSVLFYNHRSRLDENTYLNQFSSFFHCKTLCGAYKFGIKYVRGTVRDYFFLAHPEHVEQVEKAITFILSSNWNQHFKSLDLN